MVGAVIIALALAGGLPLPMAVVGDFLAPSSLAGVPSREALAEAAAPEGMARGVGPRPADPYSPLSADYFNMTRKGGKHALLRGSGRHR